MCRITSALSIAATDNLTTADVRKSAQALEELRRHGYRQQ